MPAEQIPTRRKPRSVSSFLKKTYQILEQNQNSYAVKWAHNGIGFVVVKEEEFSKEILPKYFKHSNYSSFVRQLNMYNFHKIREGNSESHFHHDCFRKNNRSLLSEIKRKPEKKKRKNQEYSEEEQEADHDQYNDKSAISMKLRIKELENSHSKIEGSEPRIASYRSTDKKPYENTRHAFVSEKENPQVSSTASYSKQNLNPRPEAYDSKERVSIQNILACPNEIQDDKLSINNQLAEMFPRYPTKEIFYPSNNNIFPFPANLKGATTISQFNILF